MTGHAFQVLLDDRSMLAALRTMRRHLQPDGQAVFESRNPALDWAGRWHGRSEAIDVDGAPVHYDVRVLGREGDHLTFDQHYAFEDETLVSRSVLNFPARDRIEMNLHQAQLRVENLWGDWQRGAFDPAASAEMIFAVRPA